MSSILVVDDDPIFTAAAASCLGRAGFDVVVARDGVEALDRLEQRSFALMLVDLAMPRIDGFRLIGLVRSLAEHRQLPIMVVTGRADIAAVEEAYALGADAFQMKPVAWSLLPAQIRYMLRAAQTASDLRGEVTRLTRETAAALTAENGILAAPGNGSPA